jgi:hypothetical protein
VINYQADLVILLTNGTQLGEIINHFTSHDFSYSEAHELVANAGVEFFMPRSVDFFEISPERRRQLQELSLAE